MNNRIRYKNEPIKLKVIDDFLPSPEQLVLKNQNVKITITLSKESIDFFREFAKKKHSHYQSMIRNILDSYVSHYRGA